MTHPAAPGEPRLSPRERRLLFRHLGVDLVECDRNGRKEVRHCAAHLRLTPQVADHALMYELGKIAAPDAVILVSQDRDFRYALSELADRGVDVGVIGFTAVPNLPAQHRWVLRDDKLELCMPSSPVTFEPDDRCVDDRYRRSDRADPRPSSSRTLHRSSARCAQAV